MYQEIKPKPGATCELGDTGYRNHIYTGTPTRRILLHVDSKTDQGRECCELARTQGPYFSVTKGVSEPDTEWCSLFTGGPNGTEPPIIKTKRSWAGKAGVTSGEPVKQKEKIQLWPSWPASSPYVTAVGATRFVGQRVGEPEMATDQFGSGGGFSQMFTQEDAKWQVEAVKHYVDNPPDDMHYPPKGTFPPTGRATPDVCALGEGYQVVADGHVESVGGTSASAPAFAGVVALLNEARAQKGMKPLGFLNPFLYANPEAFKDVTKGTNAIGRGNGPIKYGFNATAGWDPATGLGSPIFPKLLEAALKAGN